MFDNNQQTKLYRTILHITQSNSLKHNLLGNALILKIFTNTVKPLQNDQTQDPQKVVVVQRWLMVVAIQSIV